MAKKQTAAQTLDDVIKWRPALRSVLEAFAPVLTAQEELAAAIAAKIGTAADVAAMGFPAWEYQRMTQGLSLLPGTSLEPLVPHFVHSAEVMLPLLEERLDMVRENGAALRRLMDAGVDSRQCATLMEALAADEQVTLGKIAEQAGISEPLLGFAGQMVLSPVLHGLVQAMTADLEEEEKELPWEENNAWQQGYCPVCGALPTISWLSRPAIDAKNAYLAGGGGKKHLHCSQCGADWKFPRAKCPACGNGESLKNLRETENNHGERIDWCGKCKGYCCNVDLRERLALPNLDALALGLMHLDMVAAQKKLRPLRPMFWNMM